jgi:hypothetical protein
MERIGSFIDMKRVGFLLMFLLLPSLAHAQNIHTSFFNGGTSLTATCTATTGSLASSDIFLGTAQGNTTVTLPTAATGCLDYDVIDLRFTQAASQSFTLTVSGGSGTTTLVISNGGALLAAPAGAASGAANVLHQIWVYNAVATTPQWELVTQETNGQAVQTTLGIVCSTNNVNCVTQADSGATQRALIGMNNSNNLLIGGAVGTGISGIDINTAAATNILMQVAGGQVLDILGSTKVSAPNGATYQSSGGTLPTVTGGCGSGSVNTGSTNNRGSVTTGTAETSCQVVFSASGGWSNAPFCLCGDGGGDAAPLGCSVSGQTTAHFTLTFAAATAKTFNYICY